MNYISLFFCFALFSNGLHAQSKFSDAITWGEHSKSKALTLYPDFFNLCNDKIISISGTWTKPFIEEFDPSTGQRLNTQRLVLEYEKNDLEREEQFVFNDQLVFISSYINRSQATKYFFLQTYIGEGKTSAPVHIGNVKWEDVGGAMATGQIRTERNQASLALKVAISPNGKSFSVLIPAIPFTQADKENVWKASVFNQSLEKQSDYTFTLDNNMLFIDKVKLSDDHIIYCSGIENVSMERKIDFNMLENFEGNFIGDDYFLIRVDPSTKTVETTNLDLKSANIVSYSLDLINDFPFFYGFTGRNIHDPEGVLVCKLDKFGEIIFTTNDPFSKDLFTYNEETDPKSSTGLLSNKKNNVRQNLMLKDLVITENGNVTILAEQFYTYLVQSRQGSYAHYVYGDLIAIQLNSTNGEVNWMKRIVKYQHSIEDFGFYSSFLVLTDKNDLYLLMNDTEYYANYAELKDAENSIIRDAKKNKVLTELKLSSNGETKRIILDENYKREEKTRKVLSPKSAIIKNQELLLMGREQKNLSLSLNQTIGRMSIH